MLTLAECLTLNSRGKTIYTIARAVSPDEKRQLLEQFAVLHAGQKIWRVKMHMPKRHMPFAQHSNILFRSSKLAVNELLIEFDTSTITRNSTEQNMVWEVMRGFFATR
ncbi:hypothetical protein F0P96_20590 [Hymenobacter busanensis]|uniref:Uncharacterized protein n=1 Tax=Hymenobacter busanensis TaxID=2607656 RepID=A0AA88FGG8_9BACT|nr:hypothetical protein [Hymenobacter busanensis]KAA9325098.1 hypothetical protein F0P96_20590 [Hymenobacter busanensis]